MGGNGRVRSTSHCNFTPVSPCERSSPLHEGTQRSTESSLHTRSSVAFPPNSSSQCTRTLSHTNTQTHTHRATLSLAHTHTHIHTHTSHLNEKRKKSKQYTTTL